MKLKKKKYREIPIPISVKKYEILIIDIQMVAKKDNTSPTLLFTNVNYLGWK